MAISADELQLVERAREGDVGAFSSLVVLYQERAIRLAWSWVGNLEDARDLAQDAFVKAYENLSDFRGQSRFFTWFYRILANRCKDFLRKKRLRRYVPFLFADEEGGAPEPADDGPGAGEALLSAELGGEIKKALERLPARQREAFALRYLEGLSVLEVAEALGVSEGAAKAHLWQAGQKMREWLKAYAGSEEV